MSLAVCALHSTAQRVCLFYARARARAPAVRIITCVHRTIPFCGLSYASASTHSQIDILLYCICAQFYIPTFGRPVVRSCGNIINDNNIMCRDCVRACLRLRLKQQQRHMRRACGRTSRRCRCGAVPVRTNPHDLIL